MGTAWVERRAMNVVNTKNGLHSSDNGEEGLLMYLRVGTFDFAIDFELSAEVQPPSSARAIPEGQTLTFLHPPYAAHGVQGSSQESF